MAMEVNLYGGLCPKDGHKLEFRVTDTDEKTYLLFATCNKCEHVYMLDIEEHEFSLDNVEINYDEKLDMEE